MPLPAGLRSVAIDRVVLFAEDNPQVVVEPQNLAYVIYTSGSTGRPKGALLSHANVGRLLSATADEFAFGPSDAVDAAQPFGGVGDKTHRQGRPSRTAARHASVVRAVAADSM